MGYSRDTAISALKTIFGNEPSAQTALGDKGWEFSLYWEDGADWNKKFGSVLLYVRQTDLGYRFVRETAGTGVDQPDDFDIMAKIPLSSISKIEKGEKKRNTEGLLKDKTVSYVQITSTANELIAVIPWKVS